MAFELRPPQRIAIEKIYDWFRTKKGNPLVSFCTGGGKSLIIASICKDAMKFENQHIIVCVHSKELVGQNFKELYELCPEICAGIYCAGLGKKQIRNVTFASIQSISKIKETPWCDLLIIDEVQAVNDEKENSLYASFISRLRTLNPNMPCLGLSATIWRTGSGLLYEGEGRLFEGLAYEYSISDGVRDGYLVPLISKHSTIQGNRDNIGISQGDFKIVESETEFDRSTLTQAALDEVFKYGSDRKAWLFFCITIRHAEHVRDALRERGIIAESVSDKTPEKERDRILSDYKAGKIRALCSVNIAAVGFNATIVDLIAILRPTLSVGWHVQALGRGCRLHPGKQNCLVLDFSGNLESLGPVSHVVPPTRGRRQSKEEYAGRVCPKCESVSAAGSTECVDCGFVFPIIERKIKHSRKAAVVEVMSSEPKISEIPQWLDVKFTRYELHQKAGSSASVKVTYKSQAQWVYEWVCFGHIKDYPRQRAESWWIARHGKQPIPASAIAALERIHEIGGIRAKRIKVKKSGKYTEVSAYELVPSIAPIKASSGNLGNSLTHEESNAPPF